MKKESSTNLQKYSGMNEIYKELLAEQKEVNKHIKAYNEILKQHNNYLMNLYNISRGL